MTKKFTPWVISRTPIEVGKKFLSKTWRACEVTSCEAEYLDSELIASYEEMDLLRVGRINPEGTYYKIKYKNISNTPVGKKILKKSNAEMDKIGEEVNSNVKAMMFVARAEAEGIKPTAEEFRKKYLNDFEKATHYEVRNGSYRDTSFGLSNHRLYIVIAKQEKPYANLNYGNNEVIIKDLTTQELEFFNKMMKNNYLLGNVSALTLYQDEVMPKD